MNKSFKLTEQNYGYLFDNASDAMWIHDLEGDILVVNKACEKLTGYNNRELVGMNITKFVTAEFLDKAREVRRKLIEGAPFEQPYEQRLIRKDGSTGLLRISTTLLVVDGEVKGFQHVARDVTEEKQMQENMRYYIEQITRAQEDERKRTARELHDDLAPPILLLLQRLDSVASQTRPRLPDSVKIELEELRRQAVEVLEGLRRCAQHLRPRILDDLGLIPALEWLADDMERTYSITARVDIVGAERTLPNEVQLLLFRIAQETLSNIRKHARATAASISFEFAGDKVKLTVSDNGQGFEIRGRPDALASNGKLGILGMYERARLLGGKLNIESEPGKGTRVVTDVPLKL